MKKKTKNDKLLRSKLDAFEPEPSSRLTFGAIQQSMEQSRRAATRKTILGLLFGFGLCAAVSMALYLSPANGEQNASSTVAEKQPQAPVQIASEDQHRQNALQQEETQAQPTADPQQEIAVEQRAAAEKTNGTPPASRENEIVPEQKTAGDAPAMDKKKKTGSPAAEIVTTVSRSRKEKKEGKKTMTDRFASQGTAVTEHRYEHKQVSPTHLKRQDKAENSSKKPSYKEEPENQTTNNDVVASASGKNTSPAASLKRTKISRKSEGAVEDSKSPANGAGAEQPASMVPAGITAKQGQATSGDQGQASGFQAEKNAEGSKTTQTIVYPQPLATFKEEPPTRTPAGRQPANTAPEPEAELPEPIGQTRDGKFHIATGGEAVFNIMNIKQGIGDNVSDELYYADSSVYAQQYLEASSVERSRQISSSLQMGLSYNDLVFNIGLGYLSYETKINTSGLSFRPLNKVVDKIIIKDTLNPQQADTVYKLMRGPKSVIVNGEAVNPGEYVSTARFMTVPLSFSYRFNLSKKMILEPSAGVQLFIPVKSKHLVAVKPHEFVYTKNKTSFRDFQLFYDFTLKLQYKVSRSAFVYVKQGYFFSNLSLNQKDYILKTSLENIYTTVGVSFNLY